MEEGHARRSFQKEMMWGTSSGDRRADVIVRIFDRAAEILSRYGETSMWLSDGVRMEWSAWRMTERSEVVVQDRRMSGRWRKMS